MSELLDTIQSRGYWKVVIHPATFDEKRIPDISDLYPIIEKTSVQVCAWHFPFLESNEPFIDNGSIYQESERGRFLEVWRFYQSGQFVDFSGIPDDWLDQSALDPAPPEWKPGKSLSLEDTLLRFSEVFEFAARLAFTKAGDLQMHIEVAINGLQGRTLQSDEPGLTRYLQNKKASLSTFPYKTDVSFAELITEPRVLALEASTELFKRFGWNASLEILRDMQDQLFHRGVRAANP